MIYARFVPATHEIRFLERSIRAWQMIDKMSGFRNRFLPVSALKKCFKGNLKSKISKINMAIIGPTTIFIVYSIADSYNVKVIHFL